MSRIGRNPITIPAGVTVTIGAENEVTVKGPLGTLTDKFNTNMTIECKDGVLTVARPDDEKQNRAFHGLTRERSDARKFPAIDPIGSWSKYKSVIRNDWVSVARSIYKSGVEVNQMMKVIGEEGTTTQDFVLYMKSEFLDYVYFQQNSFDEVDAAVSVERQTYTFKNVLTVLTSDFELTDKDDARGFFNQLRQKFLDWNYIPWNTAEFKAKEKEILDLYASKKGTIQASAMDLFKDGE